MTYQTEIEASRTHGIGYYLDFEGIAAHIATHDFGASPYSLSGTYHAAIIVDSMGTYSETLDRASGIASQGSLTMRVMGTAAVLAFFARRGGTEVGITGALQPTSATITIDTGTNTYDDGTTLYLDRETVTLGTHTSGGAYTGCTRGVSGSVAAAHGQGAVLSTKPRHFYTRWATLYAVNLSTNTTNAIMTGTLSRPPRFVDGAWELELTGAINDLLQRPVCSGFADIEAIRTSWDDDTDYQIYVPHYLDVVDTASQRLLRVEGDGRVYFFQDFDAVNAATDYIDIDPSRLLPTGEPLASLDDVAVTVRQVHRIVARPGHVANIAMLSVDGDAANHATYDVLPGVHPDGGYTREFTRKRMGAGIDAARVDDTTFALVRQNKLVQLWLDEEQKLGDLLANEVIWRMGGYVYMTPAGKISFREYLPYGIRSLLPAWTEADIIHGSVVTVDDETEIIGRATFDCNYSPTFRKFLKHIEVVWEDDLPIYGDRGTSSQRQSKSLVVGQPVTGEPQAEADSLVSVESMFDRQRSRQKYAGRQATFTLPWSKHVAAVIGYRFTMTHTRMPDLEGGASVSGRAYEIVGRSLDFGEGTVTVDVEEIPRGWLLGPSALVASYGSGTITLDTADAELGAGTMYDADPGSDFAAAWNITIYDASATPPFSSSETADIDTVGASTVTLGAPFATITPAAGDIVVIAISADSGNTNADGADVEDYAFAADSAYTVDSPARAGPTWG